MPPRRTSRRSKLPEGEVHLDSEASETDPPTPSFNGQLSKFQHISTTSTRENAPPTPPITTRSKRTRTTVTLATSDTSPPSSSPPPKKKRKPSSYAPPSKYAHLSPLTDILEPNLICVFIGTNPGIRTASLGHAYAHPSNSFWKLLHSSRLTDRRLSPSEDRCLPARYLMGNTNIVARPSKDAAELSRSEMLDGAAELETKMRAYRPEAVCVVGKGIWEAVFRYKKGRAMRREEFEYGWQEGEMNMGRGEDWEGSRVFVATSTSGLAAGLRMGEKEAIWRPFGEWVEGRRRERGFVIGGGEGGESGS